MTLCQVHYCRSVVEDKHKIKAKEKLHRKFPIVILVESNKKEKNTPNYNKHKGDGHKPRTDKCIFTLNKNTPRWRQHPQKTRRNTTNFICGSDLKSGQIISHSPVQYQYQHHFAPLHQWGPCPRIYSPHLHETPLLLYSQHCRRN